MKRDPSPISATPARRYNGAHESGCVIVKRASRVLRLALVCVLLTTAGAASAGVQGRVDHVVMAKSDAISLEEATDIVRRAYGGRVLSATPVNKNGKRGYQIRVLLDGGRVKTVFVDSNGSVQG